MPVSLSKSRISWSSLFAVACLFFVGFLGERCFLTSGQESQESTLEPTDLRIKQLETIALQIYDGVLDNDTSVILNLIDREEGIRWGPDGSRTYQEAERDLQSGKGPLYCVLFGCSGYDKKSIREFFAEVKRSDLNIEIRVLGHYGSNEPYAEVIYNWPEKPIDLWVTDLPNPKFRWLHEGWKFESVFME